MTAPPSSEHPGAFTPLRHRSFSLLFIGQLVSALGDQAFALALPWTVLTATGDVAQVALVLAAEAVPRVLLLPVGGVLADRINPRLIMLLSDLGRAAVVSALGMTLLSGLPPLWVVALLAALQGIGSGLYLPGSQAIVPWTVRNVEIPAANGLMQIILWLTMLIGPVLGGIAVGIQAAIAFLADAASFIVSAITLAGIRLSAPDTPAAKASAANHERTGRQSADSSEAPPVMGKSLLVLTTPPRFAFIQTVIEEIEVEEIALENAVPEQSTSIATIANDEAVAQHEGAVDDSDLEKAEDPSKGPSLGESATDSHGALLVITSPPRVTPESQPARPARSSVLAEIGAGVSYSVGQPLMRTAIVASTLGNLAYTGTFGVALLVLSKSLDPSAVTLGLLLGASGVGGVLGGLAAGPVGRSRHRAIAALLLWLLMPIALTLVPIYAGAAAALPFPLDLNLANFGNVTLAGVHLGVLNIGDQVAGLTIPGRLLAIAILLAATSGIIGFGETIFITILQQRIPPELMARVFSIQLMVAGAAQPLSLLAAGVLTAAFGAGVAFFAAAALFFIAAIIGFSSSALRRG